MDQINPIFYPLISTVERFVILTQLSKLILISQVMK